jgi:hypothetical protein
MVKTFDDYMNDPDIINEPMGLRITHAMRFKVQDDIKDMTIEEQIAYYNRRRTENIQQEFTVSFAEKS